MVLLGPSRVGVNRSTTVVGDSEVKFDSEIKFRA